MIDTQGQTAVPATASDQPSMPQEVPSQPQTTPSEAPAQAPAEPSPPPPEAPDTEEVSIVKTDLATLLLDSWDAGRPSLRHPLDDAPPIG